MIVIIAVDSIKDFFFEDLVGCDVSLKIPSILLSSLSSLLLVSCIEGSSCVLVRIH